MKSLNLGCTPSYPKCPIACQQFTNNSLSIHSLAWSAKEKVASVAGKNNYIMKVNKENNWIADKVPTKYVGLIKDMYNNIVTSVRTSDGDTDNFPIRI